MRATVDKVFLNCARYIHKHQRLEDSPYAPKALGEQPFPTWKRIDMLQDHLPSADQGVAASEGGTITMEDYQDALNAGES